MAVFRVKGAKNFTVMSNRHLRDKSISLKAKGLLSQMLSLPEDWDYTLRGLAAINREQVDAVRSAVRELEAAGYVERTRRRAHGRLGGAVYNVYEQPRAAAEQPLLETPSPEQPALEEPAVEQPALEEPALENPMLENPAQLKKDPQNKEPQRTEFTDLSVDGRDAAAIKQEILENTGYAELLARYPADKGLLDEIAGLIWQTRCAGNRRVHIAGTDYPAELVRERFAALTGEHVEFVLDRLRCNKTDIRDIRAYLLTALFHAPVTLECYYTARVARDMGGAPIP